MFELMLALFMAFACPAHKYDTQGKGTTTVTTQDDPTGGDGGHVPPVPPPHS